MDNKDSILILGAGIYQVPLIKKAQEMGLRAVITSIPGNYPGFAAPPIRSITQTPPIRKRCSISPAPSASPP